jgi:hypothetical protein
MNRRKLDALRNLADRPGTEAEGKLAREILARYERMLKSKSAVDNTDLTDLRDRLDDILRTARAVCPCGGLYGCMDIRRHFELRKERDERFPEGTRIVHHGRRGTVTSLCGSWHHLDDPIRRPCVRGLR